MIRTYYELTKPGIIYSNALTAIAGFFLASRETLDWGLLGATLVGLSFIMASACVFNNYFDREIDIRMERTKNRALAAGHISFRSAIIFALVLVFLGTATLALFTTALALGMALFGFFVYVFLYTPIKPRSATALYVGAVAGATPPVVGYTAVTNALDWYAFALFAALFLWQIPHFLAIAFYRYEEYKAAGVPLFIQHPPSAKTKRRARAVFYSSLIVLLLFCVALVTMRLFT